MSAVSSRLLPRVFQSLRSLRVLNIASVGFALAALATPIFAHLFSTTSFFGEIGVSVGLPTVVLGAVWAWVLRLRPTIGKTQVRWGWLGSVPLAMLNGALACGLMLANGADGGASQFLIGLVFGATFGAFLWVPALIITLVLFGLPIAWSQKLASQGLAGEERGELAIGATSTIMSLLGALVLLAGRAASSPSNPLAEWLGYHLMWICAIAGVITGSAAAVLAQRREARRRSFLKDVEAGAVEGFRIDEAPEGKVLVRVTSMGQGYRVANFEEALVELDAEGEAKKAMRAG